MASYICLLVKLTWDCLVDQQGEKEQTIGLKDAESKKEFKLQDSLSLEEVKQVRNEPQSETRVKTSINIMGKYDV